MRANLAAPRLSCSSSTALRRRMPPVNAAVQPLSYVGGSRRFFRLAPEQTDMLLIGAGVMSATMATLAHNLNPRLKIHVVEARENAGQESSDGWNNAGTGHAGCCELNYTPRQKDLSVKIGKAIDINTSFGETKQFWAYLVKTGVIKDPRSFIHPVPHISFVEGPNDVTFLRNRYEAMSKHHCFGDVKFSDNYDAIKEWVPLMYEGRKNVKPVAATFMNQGADCDYGALTRVLFDHLEEQENVSIEYEQKVVKLYQDDDHHWIVTTKGANGTRRIRARFVFIGAGGAALTLLQKSGISEAKKYGGFPVSGQWLRCDKPDIVDKHHGKVYSKAAIGAPPMSVPHLDTRVIGGKKSILFGPFAGYTTKFLKQGSFFDLPLSIHPGNIIPMLSIAKNRWSLVEYLLKEVMLSHKQRVQELRAFYPDAKDEDWSLEVAGQRVQVIRRSPTGFGELEFGTEVVTGYDNTIAALLGASPGASTAVSIMLAVLQRCFPDFYSSKKCQAKLREIFLARKEDLATDPQVLARVRTYCHETLNLAPYDPGHKR